MHLNARMCCDEVMSTSDSQQGALNRSTPVAGQLGRRARLTRAERAAAGRAARKHASRGGHGEWRPTRDRADPVGMLEEQGASRVPELVPIRYGRMLVSPFTSFAAPPT